MTDEIERLRNMYATQYNPDPQDRNYIWHPLNPVSIYYRQAQERAMAELFRRNDLNLSKLNVLDIGCGNGGLLRYLASLGISPNQLSGIDLMIHRITAAHRLAPPGTTLLVGNAETLPYPEQCFDLVVQFTVFSSILDAQLRQSVATEMMRVLKRGGQVLWYDMYKTRNTSLHSMTISEISQLFPGMEVRYLQRLHPIYVTRILSYGRFLTTLWENLPGLPMTHYLILFQKP
jgi:ubiquinone/menaquinone biosynthesis C-methylase UbiE